MNKNKKFVYNEKIDRSDILNILSNNEEDAKLPFEVASDLKLPWTSLVSGAYTDAILRRMHKEGRLNRKRNPHNEGYVFVYWKKESSSFLLDESKKERVATKIQKAREVLEKIRDDKRDKTKSGIARQDILNILPIIHEKGITAKRVLAGLELDISLSHVSTILTQLCEGGVINREKREYEDRVAFVYWAKSPTISLTIEDIRNCDVDGTDENFDKVLEAMKSILKNHKVSCTTLMKQLLDHKIVKSIITIGGFLSRAVSEGYLNEERIGEYRYYSLPIILKEEKEIEKEKDEVKIDVGHKDKIYNETTESIEDKILEILPTAEPGIRREEIAFNIQEDEKNVVVALTKLRRQDRIAQDGEKFWLSPISIDRIKAVLRNAHNRLLSAREILKELGYRINSSGHEIDDSGCEIHASSNPWDSDYNVNIMNKIVSILKKHQEIERTPSPSGYEQSHLLYRFPGVHEKTDKNKEETTSKGSEEMKIEFGKLSNPIMAFIEERCILEVDYLISVAELYEHYKEYCSNENIEIVGKGELSKKIGELRGVSKTKVRYGTEKKVQWCWRGIDTEHQIEIDIKNKGGETKMRKLTIDEYEELGEYIKEVHEEVHNLHQVVSEKMPKNVHRRGFDKILKGFLVLKSDLDERLFVEHRNDEDANRLTNVFYGGRKTKNGATYGFYDGKEVVDDYLDEEGKQRCIVIADMSVGDIYNFANTDDVTRDGLERLVFELKDRWYSRDVADKMKEDMEWRPPQTIQKGRIEETKTKSSEQRILSLDKDIETLEKRITDLEETNRKREEEKELLKKVEEREKKKDMLEKRVLELEKTMRKAELEDTQVKRDILK